MPYKRLQVYETRADQWPEQALVEADLDGIVVAHRLRERQRGRPARRVEGGRAPEAGVADRVDLGLLRVQGADVLDRPVQLLVDVARGDRQVRRELALDAQHDLLQPHLVEVGVDRVVVGSLMGGTKSTEPG